MSYAAYKLFHAPTGVENCVAAFLTHAPEKEKEKASAGGGSGSASAPALLLDDEPDAALLVPAKPPSPSSVALPNVVISKGNVLEVYRVRVQDCRSASASAASSALPPPSAASRGGVMDGISSAWLELVCHYRLHGHVESMAVLSYGRDDGRKRRDAIVLSFRDAKASVLDFDDSIHGLSTSSMHYFEGPDWQFLKKGHERFPRGPLLRADPQGRCAGLLVYDCEIIMLKAAQEGYGLGDEEEGNGLGGTIFARVESSYVVSMRDMDVKHIKDFVFLHGYIEPVLLVLHEKEYTWAGRSSLKRHTCSITAFSINTTSKQHPLIWSAANLPYDMFTLLAVPSPIGGVIVIGANSIHYHSQSSNCALALNEFAVPPDGSSEWPRSTFSIELDGSHATWLSHDMALISTKMGSLLLLSLVYDGRTVHKLELTKSKASVLTSCMCVVGDMFFFLGSRLGDSLLVQFSSGTTSAGISASGSKTGKDEGDIEGDISNPAPKRLRRASSDMSQDIVSAEELSLYHTSSANSDSSLAKNFSFAVRDSLINIAPLRDFANGFRKNADISAVGASKQSNNELVCCSGHGKNGSLAILHQSIRPELITEVELESSKGMWTVHYKGSKGTKSDSAVSSTSDDDYHAYLVISLENRTMVLETGETLGEVTEAVDYYTAGATILAGNLFARRRIVQVHGKGVHLLDGAFMNHTPLSIIVSSEDSSVKSKDISVIFASIADPYVLLHMTDGSLQLVTGDPETCGISISAPNIFQVSEDPVTASSLYHDKGSSPWLRSTSMDAWLAPSIDLMEISEGSMTDQGDIYCLVCRRSGKLELYELPSLTCVFSVNLFTHGKKVLFDKKCDEKDIEMNGASDQELKQETGNTVEVVEICLQSWGEKSSSPFLFSILSDGSFFCYKAYMYEDVEKSEGAGVSIMGTSRLKNLRFVRLPLDWVTSGESTTTHRSRIIPFRNVGGLQGAFVTGVRPTWIMICREHVRAYPQLSDGSISAFTPLHNVNCNHGFIYITSQGFLKICQLPSLNYDNDWPVQKIPLRGTPHQIAYHADANLYALIVSFPVMRTVAQIIEAADQASAYITELEAENSQKLVTLEDFEIRIIEPGKSVSDWKTKSTIALHITEHALTLKVVHLKNTSAEQTQTQTLMSVGTAYVQGEDVPSRGRILLLSVGQDSSNPNNWAKEVYSKELKGAISAIASLQGNLLVAIGPKIILHTWNGSELNGAAFFDAPLYVVSLNVVKNFVLFGDIHKSIYFLCWKEEGSQLLLLAKDFGSLDCYATEFLIDGSTLSLLVSDSQENIQIFSYSPKSVESWKGQKLLPRAEIHMGSPVTRFIRQQMLPGSSSARSTRFALLFGTLDGGVGCIAPLDELTFRRLQTLQKVLVDAVPHVAGLNPVAFRKFKSSGKAHRPSPESIVDCELLSQYEMLPLEEQIEIAHQVGTSRSQILTNLSDLTISTTFL